MARPENSPEDLAIGEAVAWWRRRRGLTQEELAERSEISPSVVRKLERGERSTVSIATLRKLAGGLDVTTVELFRPTPRFEHVQDDDADRDDLYALRRVLQPARLLRASVTDDLADGDEPPMLAQAHEASRQVAGLFRDGQFATAVDMLPAAITDTRRAVAALEDRDRLAATRCLAQVYQTAGMVLTQLGRYDLAYSALGMAMDAGRDAGDDVLVASAVNGENWLLTRQARFDEAEAASLAAVDAIEPSLTRSSLSHVAIWGWLNLGAAAAATRNNRLDVADDAMRRAKAAAVVAAPYKADEVAHWTRFGPAVVAMRDVELAMVVGDAGRALRAARAVPATARPRVTYQRFSLDLAAAYLDVRRHDQALRVLARLHRTAPGWLRHQGYARSITRRVLSAPGRTVAAELREIADFLDLDS